MSQANKQYFITVWSRRTWRAFLKAGGTTYGVSDRYRALVNGVRPGDVLLCYMNKVGELFAALEVTGPTFYDTRLIWDDGVFPVRLPVKEIVRARQGIPVLNLWDRLSIFTGWDPSKGKSWGSLFHQSIKPWSEADGLAALIALQGEADG